MSICNKCLKVDKCLMKGIKESCPDIAKEVEGCKQQLVKRNCFRYKAMGSCKDCQYVL